MDRLLHIYVVRCDGSIPPSLGQAVHAFLQGPGGDQGWEREREERWGLEIGELDVLREKIRGNAPDSES